MKPIASIPLVALVALCFTLSHAAAVPPAEQLLPDDTLLMFTAPDSAKLREMSHQSSMGQLWNDSAMKPFKDKFLVRLREELIVPLERELGVKFDDYAALAQGQFTLALTRNGWSGAEDQKPGALLLLDAREKQDALKQALADFRKKWTEAGKMLRIEKVRDVEFMGLTLTTNDIPNTLKEMLPGPSDVRELGDGKDEAKADPADSGTHLLIGQVESLFIVGNDLAAVERIVARLTGGSAPVLADVPQFQSCQPAFFRDAQMFGWANAKTLVEVLNKLSLQRAEVTKDAPDPLATIRPEKIMEAMGLAGVRSAAFAYHDSPEGPLMQLHLNVPEAERKGFLIMLAGAAKETTPPPFVPADAVKYTRWRMDGQKTWKSLTNTLAEISPAIMSTMDFILNTAEAAGKQTDEHFDVRRLIISNLGDDLIAFQKMPRGTTPSEPGQEPSITLIGAKNAGEMAEALKVILGALVGPDNPPVEREFLGRKIYTVTTLVGPQLDPTNPRLRRLLLSSSSSHVVIANDEAILEEFLRSGESQPKALREMPGLSEAAAKVTGPGTSFFSFENQQETQRASYTAMKQALTTDTNAAVSGMTPIPESFGVAMPKKSVKDWLDFSLLPPYDAVAKYYNFVVIGGGADVNGLTLKIFTPTPPALMK